MKQPAKKPAKKPKDSWKRLGMAFLAACHSSKFSVDYSTGKRLKDIYLQDTTRLYKRARALRRSERKREGR